MSKERSPVRYRFGKFEVDASTGELRRQGVRVRLAAQPMDILLMLLERPGELLTRAEISQRLWPEGTFVDYEHGVNSAVNRIREAIGDNAGNPRFVETLARRGYRFIAPVEPIGSDVEELVPLTPDIAAAASAAIEPPTKDREAPRRILASPDELPHASHQLVRTLFLLLQVMYLGFYVGLLFNLPEVHELLSSMNGADIWFGVLVVTAAALIPARVFLICALIFSAPGMRAKALKLWPFLLLHHVSMGVALACTALLVYSPFAQRSLVLMGAAGE